MKKRTSLLSGAGALLSFSLMAAAQSAQTPLNATALGALEGTLDFCAKMNPQSAVKYKEMRKDLTKDQAPEAVAEMRESQEYKDSADEIRKQLGAMSPKEAIATCKGTASGTKTGPGGK